MYIVEKDISKYNKKYLLLMESFRDKNGKSSNRVIKNYGSVTDEKYQSNRAEAEKIVAEWKKENESIKIEVNFGNKNEATTERKNLGYVILDKIYEDLHIEKFLDENITKQKRSDAFDINEVLKLLIFSRILNPDSKLGSFQNKNRFFKDFDLKINNMYDGLSELEKVESSIQLFVHQEISKMYTRQLELVFYDVTNYFFETEYDDPIPGLKAKGPSKEKRITPIVQMGLLMDEERVPIAYKLFRGNTHDASTLVPIIDEFKATFGINKIKLVADKGLNSKTNLKYLIDNGHQFIVSQKVRGTTKDFKEKVLSDDGYKWNENKTYKSKEFLWEKAYAKSDGNQEGKIRVISWWSADFDRRTKHERGDIEEKMNDFINNPSKLNASNAYGVKKYLKEIIYDKDTGEIKENCTKNISLNIEKYKADLAMDGFYCLITNDFVSTKEQIQATYKQLVNIEESFRVMKSDLEGRPVYVWTDQHVKAHFLTCFLSLVVLRLLQRKMEWKYSAGAIIEALNSADSQLIQSRVYLLSHQNEIFKEISKTYELQIDSEFLKEETIRTKFKKFISNSLSTTK